MTPAALLAAALASLAGPGAESELERALSAHPYFSRVALERVEVEPFLFLVQRDGHGDASRSATLAQKYAERARPALQLFQEEVAAPLGLARPADAPPLVVAILVSPGDLENYRSVTQARAHHGARGYHDATLNAAVLSEDPFHAQRSGIETPAARHQLLHVCQRAFGGEGARTDAWILEAMAHELARRDPGDARRSEPDAVRAFLRDTQDDRGRWQRARTLAELAEAGGASGLEEFFRAHAASGPLPDDLAEAELAFGRQGALLWHFLFDGDGGQRRAQGLALVRSALAGESGPEALARALAPVTSAELDAEFLEWALRAHAAGVAAKNEAKIDPAAARKLLERNPRAGAPAGAAAAAAGSPAAAASGASPAADPAVTVPGLAVDLAGASGDDVLALALFEIGRGRARAGIAALERLAAGAGDDATRERAERELARARAWVELRDRFLAERKGTDQVLEFTYKGRKLKSLVLGFEDGVLLLEKSRAPERLAADAIPALDLATQIEAGSGPDAWMRIYPYVLADDPRGRKLLSDDGGEGGRLLADARDDYPPRLKLGAVVGRLAELSTRAPAKSAKDLRAQLEELEAWARDAQGLAILEKKRDALRAHAGTLLERELALLEPAQLVRGALEKRKDGSARLVYEFEDPRELEDFSAAPYPPKSRRSLGTEGAVDEPFRVEKGALVARGSASLRSLFDVAAPMTVRWTLELGPAEETLAARACALGICDDGREHFVWASDLATLQSTDPSGPPAAQGSPLVPKPGTRYALELRHDGKDVKLVRDGDAQATIAAGQRQVGALFLCACSDAPLRIERLEIECELPPDAFERVKRGWVERGLARF